MSVTSDLPTVDLPPRRRSSRASVIPFPRARDAVPPGRAGAAPGRSAGPGGPRPAASRRQLAAGAGGRAVPAAAGRVGAPEAVSGGAPPEVVAGGGASARAGGASVAARPELSVIAGAARPLRLVTASPAGRPTLAPHPAAPSRSGGGQSRSVPVTEEWRPRSPARAARPGGARLTRRGRLVLAAVGTLTLAAVLTLVAPALANVHSPAAARTNAPAVIVVQPGDTLWSIARRIAPDRDARLVVADLRRMNALPSADLEVGQRLQVRGG